MTTLNDRIRIATGLGTVNDGLFAWFGAQGGTGNTLNDREHSWLLSVVGGAQTVPINDLWMQYLGAAGYTGALNDRQYAFWEFALPSKPILHYIPNGIRDEGASGRFWDADPAAGNTTGLVPQGVLANLVVVTDPKTGQRGLRNNNLTTPGILRTNTAAVNIVQPFTVVMAAQMPPSQNAANAYIADGRATSDLQIIVSAAGAGAFVSAGTNLTVAQALADSELFILGAEINGATSELRVNSTTATGPAGANAWDALTAFVFSDGSTAPFDGSLYEIAVLPGTGLLDSLMAQFTIRWQPGPR